MAKKLNAVVAINALNLDGYRPTGIGHHTLQLAFWFGKINAERGMAHRVLVICRHDASVHLANVTGIEVRTVNAGNSRFTRVLYEQLLLPFLMWHLNVDVVINPAFTGPVWGARTVVTVVQDLYFKVVPELLNKAQLRYLSAFVPFCCRRSQIVLTTSVSTMSDLVNFYPELKHKIRVVPLASRMDVSVPPLEAGRVGENPYVLMVAALTGNKNPGPLVAAISILRQSFPKLKLVHVGKDPFDLLKNAITKHYADDWVQCSQDISDHELKSLYSDCLCVAIPSLYEGFGLPLLEAQALGAAVVSSNRGSLPEVGGDGAIYVDPTNVEQIVDAISTLINQPLTRYNLREAGYNNQALYSWEKTARSTWSIMLETDKLSPRVPLRMR